MAEATYAAPLDDLRFALESIANLDEVLNLPAYGDFSADLVQAILEEAARFAQSELSPLNFTGDRSCSATFPLLWSVLYAPWGFVQA